MKLFQRAALLSILIGFSLIADTNKCGCSKPKPPTLPASTMKPNASRPPAPTRSVIATSAFTKNSPQKLNI